MGAPQYEQAGADVAGSGTTNTIPRWTGPTTLGDSLITQTLAGAPFEATRIRVATGVDTYAWFRDSAPSGNVLFVAANAAFSAYKGLEIASAGTYFTVGSVGVGMTSGFPGKLGVLSANAIGTADLTFSYDATGSYRHGFSNVFSSGTAANNTSTWLVWNAAGGQAQVMTANGAGNVGIGTASPLSQFTLGGIANSTTKMGFQSVSTEVGSVSMNSATGEQRITAGFATWGGFQTFYTNGFERARIDSNGNVVINTAAIATNATNGFLYVPSCAGTPTGTPTTYTGRVPIVVDTTNNKLYFYSGGAWRDAGP